MMKKILKKPEKMIRNIIDASRRRLCPICKNYFFVYIPAFSSDWFALETREYGFNIHYIDMSLNWREYSCPFCGAIDRTRLLAIYFSRCYKLGNNENVSILYCAPTISGVRYLKEKFGFHVDSIDKYRNDVDYREDIQDMKTIPSEKYDIVICSHVLEHVENDLKAIKEIYRVLKPGGKSLILIPMDERTRHYEEDIHASKIECRKRFGQHDHLRKYTENSLLEKLNGVGFHSFIFNRRNLSAKLVKQNAFVERTKIFIGEK